MPIYISRGRFTPDALKGMLAKPENREAATTGWPSASFPMRRPQPPRSWRPLREGACPTSKPPSP